MKKLTSIVLALVMALSLCTTAWAAVVETDVAKIGDTGYATLAAAVAAVTDDTATTITLLKDCTGAGIVVESGRNITFDFAGHTYTLENPTVGSAGTETNGFQLKKGSTITFKNGKLTSSAAKILIQNYCNLTLVNMVLDGSDLLLDAPNYTLSNNCGSVVIDDTTITAKEGGVAFDVYGGFGNYDDVNVTVTGNSRINGKIEVTRANSTNDNKNELSFESGTHNGDFSVTPSDKTTVAVTGGQFSANVTEFVPAGTAVAKDESGNHYVGGDSIADAANSGKEMTMVQGGPIDGLEPGAVIIVPQGVTGTTLNGNAAEWGYYTIADPNANTYLDEPIRRQNTTTTVEDTTPATKADDTTKTDTVTSAKTFDAGVVMYAAMGVMSLTGSAWVVGKKKEF